MGRRSMPSIASASRDLLTGNGWHSNTPRRSYGRRRSRLENILSGTYYTFAARSLLSERWSTIRNSPDNITATETLSLDFVTVLSQRLSWDRKINSLLIKYMLQFD